MIVFKEFYEGGTRANVFAMLVADENDAGRDRAARKEYGKKRIRFLWLHLGGS